MWRILEICNQEISVVGCCGRILGLFIRTIVPVGHSLGSVAGGCSHSTRENKETDHRVLSFIVVLMFTKISYIDE